MKIRLGRAAIRDLREIWSYLAVRDPKAAARVVARLEQSVELLAEQPHIGRPSPEALVKEWSVPGLPYVIPYRVSDNYVEIVRIYHTSRDRPPEW